MNELRMDTNRLVLHMLKDPEYDTYEVFAPNLKTAPSYKTTAGKIKGGYGYISKHKEGMQVGISQER